MGNKELLKQVKSGDLKKIRKTLDRRRSEINKQNETGDTPLHFVLKYSVGIEIVKLLFENKAKINVKNVKETPPFFSNQHALIQIL
ncbi:hypothetical protein M0812_27715 [Anaeramoeba flamelloides]|uniref:Ankyrin repeat protein n=1 Tax=Anaeramoeba flamelloides TaxID=1746091 RepID=A0AAV7Y9K0_9EUKA|nr:hypothetical protein M0812_27715 [Anaeramoeba flamelloides]